MRDHPLQKRRKRSAETSLFGIVFFIHTFSLINVKEMKI